jgi:cysteine-rich repeat protein
VIAVGERWGLCLPVVGAGESCGADSICDETQNLVCGAAGTCRLAVQAEACDGAVPLTSNLGSAGPDYYAVDRLDGLIAADESLNCTGTVGPEKVYFYTATSPVEVTIVAGATDSNGPAISWHARTATCGDIFSEVACSSASLEPTAGSVQLTAGQTLYIIVDSAARWAGGDAGAAEFFLEVNEGPVAGLGESCSAAACESGTTCASSGFCVETACGDGELGGTEACDDGNAVAGDGCTACALEVYREVEPNDEVGNEVGNARIITGQLLNPGFSDDFDIFCVPLGANGGRIEFSLASSSGGYLQMFDSGDNVILRVDQPVVRTTTSSDFCFAVYGSGGSAVDYTLELRVNPRISIPEGGTCGDQSGVYGSCADVGGAPAVCRQPEFLRRVGTCEISACGDGFVNGAAGESCDDGNVAAGDGCSATCLLETYAEIEPNNGTLTARNIGSFRAVSGDISASTDADYFKITLARRSHLEFEADSEVFGRGTYGLSIQLLSSTGAELFSGVNDIDAYLGVSGARYGMFAGDTGRLEKYTELAFLEPGTYTFRVSSSRATGAYTLFVRDIGASVVPEGGACDPTAYLPCSGALACSSLTETCASVVCGNGDVTVGEACDDGNTTDGDGCSATCAVEILPSLSLPTRPDPLAAAPVGARFTFADGSEARAYELEFPFCDCSQSFYLPIRIEGNGRVRTFNASATRIWRVGSTSPYSTLGVQVSDPTSTRHPRPRWLAAAPSLQARECSFNTSDGVCDDVTDCIDCGVPYGSPPSSENGIDTRLTPGDYLMEISPSYARTGVIVVGESPLE